MTYWTYLLIFFFAFCLALKKPILFASPPSLIFQKQIPVQNKESTFAYKVKEDDYLYKILRSFEVKEDKLANLTKEIKELNPHIQNLDTIQPGQTIFLPSHIKNNFKVKAGNPNKAIKSIEYEVKPGDYVIQIMHQKAKIPRQLIFDKYLMIFKRLNPHISDINNLQVGQKIILPFPVHKEIMADSKRKTTLKRPNAKSKSFKSSFINKTKKQTIKQDSKEEEPKNKDLALSILQKIGFRFAPGDEVLYPGPGEKWLRINLSQTPLAQTPWGNSILFVPQSLKGELHLQKDIANKDLYCCEVDSSWSLENLFSNLEDISGNRFIFWNKKYELILSKQEQVLELQADYQLVLNLGAKKKYYLFYLKRYQEHKLPNLLLGYLKNQNIYLYWLQEDEKQDQTLTIPSYPDADSLYKPQISQSKAWPSIKKHLTTTQIKKLDISSNSFNKIFQSLKDKGLAKQRFLRLFWFPTSKTKIKLTLRLKQMQSRHSSVVFLEPAQADPYLVALLSIKGYIPYILLP